MKKVVFFKDLEKLHLALDNFDINNFADKKVPVKLHLGEAKNKYFSKPGFVKHVVHELKKVNAEPYLFDTTVAYPGLRSTKTGYLKLAGMHGFTEQEVGCNVIIDDEGVPVDIENRTYEVAEHLYESTNIFAITHIKGHIQAGFGGAIKNFGMGGVTKKTKKMVHHGSRPFFIKDKPSHMNDKCTLCGACAEVCPFDALKVTTDALEHDEKACFGCGVCVDACKYGAIKHKDADFQYLLVCAAKACLQDKQVIFLNELKRISRSCDCDPFAGPVICPDIGYLVSDDAVAVDKASLDLVNDVKKNVFENVNKISPLKQIRYGEKLGLGSSSYQLIEI